MYTVSSINITLFQMYLSDERIPVKRGNEEEEIQQQQQQQIQIQIQI